MSDNMNDVLKRTIDAIKNKNKKIHKNQDADKFLLTDFSTLEFYSGELCVLSSKRGMGKTAFALSLLKQLAVDKKQPVGFVTPGSYSDEYFGQRLTAMCSGVDAIKVCTGIINASEFTKIEEAAKILNKAPIEYFNEPNCSYFDAEEAIRNMVQKQHARLIIVEGFDYFQELVDAQKGDYRDTLELLLWSFNCLATELAVPIILVIDLPETDTDNLSEPGLYDFKKYMIIPTIASKVIFIYRDRLDRSKGNSKPAKLIIAKNEYGAANGAFIKFDNRICLFLKREINFLLNFHQMRAWGGILMGSLFWRFL